MALMSSSFSKKSPSWISLTTASGFSLTKSSFEPFSASAANILPTMRVTIVLEPSSLMVTLSSALIQPAAATENATSSRTRNIRFTLLIFPFLPFPSNRFLSLLDSLPVYNAGNPDRTVQNDRSAKNIELTCHFIQDGIRAACRILLMRGVYVAEVMLC